MILIGQYDSPFVRRVGIAMTLYGIAFEHRPWSAFGDADKIRPYNPLTRVPTLVLDNGEVLIESHMILDYLDSLVSVDKRLFPASEPTRHQALKVAALAIGLGDKIVSLFYEGRLHDKVSDLWVGRCRTQIETVLAVLEADRAARSSVWWFGDQFGHADIAVAVMLRFLGDAHPGLVSLASRSWKPTPCGWKRCRFSRRFRRPLSHRLERPEAQGARHLQAGLTRISA